MKRRWLCLLGVFALMMGGACGARAEVGADSAEGQAYQARLAHCVEQIEAVTDFKPQVVIVLGSGLGDYADSLDTRAVIPYAQIEGWPVSTVKSHKGNLILAEYRGLRLAVMQGRVHYYEGYSLEEVVLPLRVLHALGADTLILTNAVGAINADYRVGDFVCVSDQIGSFMPSPLIGWGSDEKGDRFVGMTDAYDPEMRQIVEKVGEENGIPVHSGVYLQVSGPQYETPAEIRMFRLLGADTVGMSTGVETLAARQMGMRVCAISCVSNMAAGMEEEGFSHETVAENTREKAKDLQTLIEGLLDALAGEDE